MRTSTKALAHGGAPPRAPRRPAPNRGSVSKTSAQRFAARVRARRRRRVLIGSVVLLALGGLVWLTLDSPWATVKRVEVTGTDRIPVAEVRAQAEDEIGHPMLLARTADISDRVSRQRLVRSVSVRREWPGVIRVRVQERVPVAALPTGKGKNAKLALVDRDGVVIEQAATAPAGLPRLEVGLGAAEVPALRGCLEVLQKLPADLSSKVLAIGADSPDGIWLTLRDRKRPAGTRVDWGNSAKTAQKAEVLTAMLLQPGVSYDVRSPDMPAARQK